METSADATPGADPGDELDARTVFVRKLPFSLTNSQLEEIFSEVGPVRHCFLVKNKGSDEHRGFGFVQFSVTEDALRAVKEKNSALLQGRKIKVEVARRRPSLDVRHPKGDPSKAAAGADEQERPVEPNNDKVDSKKRKSAALKISASGEDAEGVRSKIAKRTDQGKKSDVSKGSAKQRSARTVVVGGLGSTEMLDAVLAEAKKAGSIESVQKTFSEFELSSRGLTKDGCKPRAAAILFVSVKAARKVVTMLHQKSILDGVVWARQLGGEGSKTKQLRLIVRNLPFQVAEETLRSMFSPAGFLWEVTVPRKLDGTGKGFAFVGFTSKADAEKGIKLVNGTLVAKRPVAVDWAVGKKQFEAAINSATAADPRPAAPDINQSESESTASESDSDNEGDDRDDRHDDISESDEEPPENEHLRNVRKGSLRRKQSESDALKANEVPPSEELSARSEDESEETQPIFSGVKKHGEISRTEELDMVKKIMTRVVSSVNDLPQGPDDEIEEDSEMEDLPKMTSPEPETGTIGKVRSKKARAEVENGDTDANDKDADSQVKLGRTVFIRNLPTEMKVPALRKLFSEFGKIQSFRLVVCPFTKKSKGNAFLEYGDDNAARAAVKRAAKNGPDEVGLILKGRPVTVSMAVDKNSARKMAKETFHKQVQEDKRNLALAKEGNILPNTAAAEGVSKKDIAKRQQLQHEKSTKLRSPNFHVSKTRLLVHNIPKSMDQKEVKKLFIDAVKSRASKQNPVVKQVKILEDEHSQRSRGAAFVEFTEHQHALVALRALNNNPASFGPESRPIVEFAIENTLILRKRAVNALQAKSKDIRGAQKKETVRTEERSYEKKGPKRKKQKTEEVTVATHDSGSAEARQETSSRRKTKKPLRGKDHQGISEKMSGGPAGDALQGTVKRDSHDAEVKSKMNDRQESKRNKTKRDSHKKDSVGQSAVTDTTQTPVRSGNQTKQGFKKDQHPGGRGKSVEGKVVQKGGNTKTTAVSAKSKGPSSQMEGNGSRRNRGKRKDAEDRLDELVNEYRQKYFSDAKRTNKTRDIKTASADLRRWFE